MSLLELLVLSSEKAARVARACREDPLLFRHLVQKKGQGEANPRFVEDFKTLADVLVQEMVKREVVDTYPEMSSSIKGEENNVFKNKLGQSVEVEVNGLPGETTAILTTVLSGDVQTAERLTTEIYREVSLSEVNTTPIPHFEMDVSSLGIWIDPIDSTSEYINAVEEVSEDGIHVSGLRCVTVLIGVYDKVTGVPVLGVVNQPFSVLQETGWSGRCFWGLHTPLLSISSLPISTPTTTNRITLSSSEDQEIKNKLQEAGFDLVEAAGAGYKILTVVRGLTDAYVLSKNTTFRWDTCAPHALLKALGGGIVEMKTALDGVIKEVTYSVRDDEEEEDGSKLERCCNAGGIIAYRNKEVLLKILEVLV